MRIKAGRYLIVDPSYLLSGAAWEAFVHQVRRFESDGLSLGCIYGQPSLAWSTGGDGTAQVLVGRRQVGKVGIDSGMLVLITGEVALDPQATREIHDALSRRLVWFGVLGSGPVRHDSKGVSIGDLRVPHVGSIRGLGTSRADRAAGLSAEQLEQMSLDELQAVAQALGQSGRGTRDELLARIRKVSALRR